MSLAQENFERALGSGYSSLSMLTEAARADEAPRIKAVSHDKLRSIVWDLEAIVAVLRVELNERDDMEPVDLG